MPQLRNPFLYKPQYVYEHHVFVGKSLPKPVTLACAGSHKALKARTVGSTIVIITYDDGCKETRLGGTKSWRNNNPGNVTLHSTDSRAHGAIGFNKSGRDIFAIYPDEKTGFNAIVALLQSPPYQQGSLSEMMQTKYAPPTENNSAAYIEFIIQKTGIPGTQPMASLNQAQIQSIAHAIQQYEGWRPGQMTWQKATPTS